MCLVRNSLVQVSEKDIVIYKTAICKKEPENYAIMSEINKGIDCTIYQKPEPIIMTPFQHFEISLNKEYTISDSCLNKYPNKLVITDGAFHCFESLSVAGKFANVFVNGFKDYSLNQYLKKYNLVMLKGVIPKGSNYCYGFFDYDNYVFDSLASDRIIYKEIIFFDNKDNEWHDYCNEKGQNKKIKFYK